MISFLERLKQDTILADGAMGTMLHRAGTEIDACFDALNLTDPAAVEAVHRAYLEAGAELLETNSFGANRFKLAVHGYADQVTEINRSAVEAAQAAIKASGKAGVYIAGAVGPLGVRMAPYGRIQPDEVQAAFYDQIAALIDGGAQAIILETFTDLNEIGEAIKAARA